MLFRQQGDMIKCSGDPECASSTDPLNILDFLAANIQHQDLIALRDSLTALKLIAANLTSASRQIYGTIAIRKIG